MPAQLSTPTLDSATLDALAAELDRQNAVLEETFDELRALGDANVAVPRSFLEELEEACRPVPRAPQPMTTMNFVRC